MDMNTTPLTHEDPLVLYGESFASRLLLGTSRYRIRNVLGRGIVTGDGQVLTTGEGSVVSSDDE